MSPTRPTTLWALTFGNFVIGTGVMAIPGSLNDMSSSLDVSVTQAGWLVSLGATVIAIGAPLFAGVVAGWDRRRLLSLNLLWYGLWLAAMACAPHYGGVLGARMLCMVAPAIFTPQAAACVGLLVPLARRGQAITRVFLGWSVASVVGMPLSAWISGTWGWRTTFGLVAGLSVAGAVWVWRTMPDGVKPPALSRSAWVQVLRHPGLLMAVAVTATSAASQFTVMAYLAPYYKASLDASPAMLSALFGAFGVMGLLGNVLISRHIDQLGPSRGVMLSLSAMALGMALLPLGHTAWLAALVVMPWGLGCFASNSAQQARLVAMAPTLASGTIALNTAAMYLGQALGAAGGGWMIDHGALAHLSWAGLVGMVLAMGLSLWATRLGRTRTGSA